MLHLKSYLEQWAPPMQCEFGLIADAFQVSLFVAYVLSHGIYNAYFHPLSKFPGPKLSGATDIVAAFYAVLGRRSKYSEKLHTKYGDVVRTRPNELSFIGENAWKDVYMHRQGQKQMAKAGRGNGPAGGVSILNASDDAHARQRRLLSHAFSERAVSPRPLHCKIKLIQLVASRTGAHYSKLCQSSHQQFA